MSRRTLRRWRLAPFLALLLVGQEPTSGQNPPRPAPRPWAAPASLYDPRLEPLRRASASWEARPGPARQVVDQVCLVPDLPTFLEAVATWDREHYFPVLFDEVESSFRFIRAFRPARVVRFPKPAAPIPRERAWERALAAVGSSWSIEGGSTSRPTGDAVPRDLGPSTPGVVLSSPEAPMLAGAVALAAGRFQPLLRLDSAHRYGDVLSLDEFEAFHRDLTGAVAGRAPAYGALGDDCDFLTLAGDWPYRVRDEKGGFGAVDDRVGRSAGSEQRWAFAGRLTGDAVESAYRAMCSLFLQPESALMFNGYDEAAPPWSDYSMRVAAGRLSAVVPTTHVSGEKAASLDGWHETFDPLNKYGLILINSHGSPTVFNVRGGPAGAADIPLGVPSAVLMIHSFSAADPADPSTVAGRWLANGAFVFFGSVNEPFLNSFRTPRLVGDLIAEKLPIAAAVRASLAEPFGTPWRLILLGDPLYRIKTRDLEGPRAPAWPPTARWPAYAEGPRPAPADDPGQFLWALKAALARLQAGPAVPPPDDIVEALLSVRRNRLPASFRTAFDALLVDVLLQARRRGALKARLASIPPADRSPALRRAYETILAIDLSLGLGQGDASRGRAAWADLIRSDASREFKEQATARVGRLADSPIRRHDWAEVLRLALRDRPRPPEAEVIAAELARVEDASKADRATAPGR